MRYALPLLLACPLALADPGCAPSQAEVMAALNAARAQVRRCGSQDRPAAPPLRWQPQLADAANRHALELARTNRISHLGAAGEALGQRVRAAGYPLRRAGENLAGGLETMDEVLTSWLASPAHCENLMSPDFEDAGLACARGAGELGTYWVLELARPSGNPIRSSPGQLP